MGEPSPNLNSRSRSCENSSRQARLLETRILVGIIMMDRPDGFEDWCEELVVHYSIDVKIPEIFISILKRFNQKRSKSGPIEVLEMLGLEGEEDEDEQEDEEEQQDNNDGNLGESYSPDLFQRSIMMGEGTRFNTNISGLKQAPPPPLPSLLELNETPSKKVSY